MIKYYPLTRIISNKYTRGNEYTLPDGANYTGRYYITYDNKAYTGINPVLGTNILLSDRRDTQSRASRDLNYPPSAQNYLAVNTSQNLLDSEVELTSLSPYYPVLLDSDYVRGYFTRYFAKNVSGPGFVFEISQLDWTKIQNGNISDTVLGYESTSMLWQLTGPLNDTRKSQYEIQGGVYSTNKRVTEAKQKSFRGIIEFIGGDYVKFAKITP